MAAPSFGRRLRTSNWTLHGTGEQLRACLDSTNRLTDDPPPPASPDFMVGVWHVDQEASSTDGTSTDMDWRSDGTCVCRHIYQNGHELDLKKDVCTWKYKPIAGHDDEFEMDWDSKMLGVEYPKQLIFKIISRTRMRNINDRLRRVSHHLPGAGAHNPPGRARELSRSKPMRTPATWTHQAELAGGFDKLGTAMTAQGDSANAFIAVRPELGIYQNLATRDPGNLTWQRDLRSRSSRSATSNSRRRRRRPGRRRAMGVQQVATAALASYQKGLAIRQQLLHAAPEDVDAQLNAAHAFSQLGIALYWSNHRAEAINANRELVRLLENIVDAHHDTPHIRVQLLTGLYYLSQISDNATEARDALRKSLAIATELDSKHEDPEEMIGVVVSLQAALAKLH